MELVVQGYDVGRVSATVGTPRSPEVEHNVFATQTLQRELLAVDSAECNLGGFGARLQKFGGVLGVEVVCCSLRIGLRLRVDGLWHGSHCQCQ